MKRVLLLSLMALIVPLFSIHTVHAIIIPPLADATIFDFDDNGTADFINSTGFPQALHDSNFQSRAFFEFPINSIINPVASAIINLNVEATNGPFPMDLEYYTYAGDGAITNGDYGLGTFQALFSYANQPTIQLDVSAILMGLLDNGDDYFGLNIRVANETTLVNGPPFVAFNSLENPDAATLNVEVLPLNSVVPEPATMLLLGSGLAGAFLRRKRIKPSTMLS